MARPTFFTFFFAVNKLLICLTDIRTNAVAFVAMRRSVPRFDAKSRSAVFNSSLCDAVFIIVQTHS